MVVCKTIVLLVCQSKNGWTCHFVHFYPEKQIQQALASANADPIQSRKDPEAATATSAAGDLIQLDMGQFYHFFPLYLNKYTEKNRLFSIFTIQIEACLFK